MGDPRSAYEHRLAGLRPRLARLERAVAAAWWGRVGAGLAVVAAVGLAADGALAAWWIAAPVAALGLATAASALLGPRAERTRRLARLQQEGLDRLDGRWGEVLFTGEEFTPPGHLYALDLDVVGERSLFTRLSTARTRPGAATLAGWLLAPAEPAELAARHAAVRELSSLPSLREALALEAGDGARDVDATALATWGEGAPFLAARWLRPALDGLAAAVVVAVSGAAAGAWGIAPALLALGAGALAHLALRRRIVAAAGEVLAPARQLGAVAALARVVEAHPFTSPRLCALRDTLREAGGAAPAFAALDRSVRRLLALRVEAVAPLGYALLWPARYGAAVERWRAVHGPRLRRWLAAVGEVEALAALATRAHEQPADVFPELVAGGAVLEAAALGHPLLPAERCVPNDVRLGRGGPRLLLLSGSNMAGKSTLLRAVGANAVLALAGGTVRARRLVLSPLALGASLRTQDSLLDGASRFQAEVLRLRDLVTRAAGPRPVLFLLDELLAGTNSHDRLQGATGVLAALLARDAIGVCTTHDLALTRIADGMGDAAANAHLADALVDGRLAFDYRLRPGVVQRSNAVEWMRLVGLEV